jgi:hypothetical protein
MRALEQVHAMLLGALILVEGARLALEVAAMLPR